MKFLKMHNNSQNIDDIYILAPRSLKILLNVIRIYDTFEQELKSSRRLNTDQYLPFKHFYKRAPVREISPTFVLATPQAVSVRILVSVC